MKKKAPDTWKFKWYPFRHYYFAYAGSMWEDCSLDYMAYQIARAIARYVRKHKNANNWASKPDTAMRMRFMVDFPNIYYLLLIDVSVKLHFSCPRVTYVNVSIPTSKPKKFYELGASDINDHLHKTKYAKANKS